MRTRSSTLEREKSGEIWALGEQLYCKVCNIKFTSSKEYKHHLDAHGARVRVGCLLCDNVFADFEHLENHMKSHSASRFAQTSQKSGSIRNPLKNHKSPTTSGKKCQERIIMRIPRSPVIDKVWQCKPAHALNCVSKSISVPNPPAAPCESVFGSPISSTAPSMSVDEETESSAELEKCSLSSPFTSDIEPIKSGLSSLGYPQDKSLSSDYSVVAVDEVPGDPISSNSANQPQTKQTSGSIKNPLKNHTSCTTNGKKLRERIIVRISRNPMIDKVWQCKPAHSLDCVSKSINVPDPPAATYDSVFGSPISSAASSISEYVETESSAGDKESNSSSSYTSDIESIKSGLSSLENPQHESLLSDDSVVAVDEVPGDPISSNSVDQPQTKQTSGSIKTPLMTHKSDNTKSKELKEPLVQLLRNPMIDKLCESGATYDTRKSKSVSVPGSCDAYPYEPHSSGASNMSTDELSLPLSNTAASVDLPGKLAANSYPLQTAEMPTPIPCGNLMNVEKRDIRRLHKRGKRQRGRKCKNEMSGSERKVVNMRKSNAGRLSSRELKRLATDLKDTVIKPLCVKRVRKVVNYQDYSDLEEDAWIGNQVNRVRKSVNHEKCSGFEEEARFVNQVVSASASEKAHHDFDSIQQRGKLSDSHSRDASKRCLQFAVKLDVLRAKEGGPSAKIEVKLIDNPTNLDECTAPLDKESGVTGSKIWITNGGSSPCSYMPGSSVTPERNTSPKRVLVRESMRQPLPTAVPSAVEETPYAENMADVNHTSPKSCDECHALDPGPHIAADENNECQTTEPQTPDFDVTDLSKSYAKVSLVCRENDFPERLSPRLPYPVSDTQLTIPVPLAACDEFSKKLPKNTEKLISFSGENEETDRLSNAFRLDQPDSGLKPVFSKPPGTAMLSTSSEKVTIVSRENEEADTSSNGLHLDQPASGFNPVSSKPPNTAMLKVHVLVNQNENADMSDSSSHKIYWGSDDELGFEGCGSDDPQSNDSPERLSPLLPSPVSFDGGTIPVPLTASDKFSKKPPKSAEQVISFSRDNGETDPSSNAFHLNHPDSGLNPVCSKLPKAAMLKSRVPVNQNESTLPCSPPPKIDWGTDDELDNNEGFASDDPKSSGFPGRRSPSCDGETIPVPLATSGKCNSTSYSPPSSTPTQEAPDWVFHSSDDDGEDNLNTKCVKNAPCMKRQPVRRSNDWNTKKKLLEAIFQKIDELGPNPPKRLCRKSSESHQTSELGPNRKVQPEESIEKKGISDNFSLIKSLLLKDGIDIGLSKNKASFRQNKGLRQILSNKVSGESPVIGAVGSALRKSESSRNAGCSTSSSCTPSTSAEPVRIPFPASPSAEPYLDDSGLDSPAAHSPQFSTDEDSADDCYRYPFY